MLVLPCAGAVTTAMLVWLPVIEPDRSIGVAVLNATGTLLRFAAVGAAT